MTPENIQIILFAAIGLVFYFFILRPQASKLKAQEVFKANIAEGEKVVTSGGIHGRIVAADANTLTVNIAKGTNIVIERTAISMELTKDLQARDGGKSE